jgi:hypothetical protein
MNEILLEIGQKIGVSFVENVVLSAGFCGSLLVSWKFA